MIAEILPPSVVVVEVFDDPPGLWLYPEEQAIAAHAVEARRAEFTTGRHCARTALARLGVRPTAIAKGERGAPVWPTGVVGSITHCAGYRAAAVAREADLVTIGIDAELNERLPADVLKLVALPRERTMLTAIAAVVPDVAWDRLLFSAKEAVYKAWFPLTRSFLEFHDAVIEFDPATTNFAARLLVPGLVVAGQPQREFTGRFAVRGGLAATVVVCAPPGRRRRPSS